MRLIDADHFLKTLETTVKSDKADPSWRKIADAMRYMVDCEATFHPVADWVHDILRRYEEAVLDDRIYKPVAYALYQAWKYYDDHEKARRSKDHDDRDW